MTVNVQMAHAGAFRAPVGNHPLAREAGSHAFAGAKNQEKPAIRKGPPQGIAQTLRQGTFYNHDQKKNVWLMEK